MYLDRCLLLIDMFLSGKGAPVRRACGVMMTLVVTHLLILAVYSTLPPPSELIMQSRLSTFLLTDEVNRQRANDKSTSNELFSKPFSTRIVPTILFNETLRTETCQKSFPSAIIAGIQKCGTTALIKFLGLHPQVVYPHGEMKFFTNLYYKGLGWYKNKMPCSRSSQITIERSPGYFYRLSTAQRMKDFNPELKLIFIVKDPIIRAQSMYAMLYRNKDPGFQKVLTNENGEINWSSKIMEYSTYPFHMKPWLDIFPRDQICFIDGHNFERHPEEELKKLEKFLNLSPYFGPDYFWINMDKGKPCFYKSWKKNKLRCLTSRKGRSHPDINEEFQKTLERHFKPLNEQFFRMINISYDWGY